jgi:hypothetical protein
LDNHVAAENVVEIVSQHRLATRSGHVSAALLGIMGLLTVGAAVLGEATAAPEPSSPEAFAEAVLAQATVPPGGQPTGGIHTLEARWLGGWGATPGTGGVIGSHAFYLYDEPPETVIRYIVRHPAPGSVLSGYGTHDGVVAAVTETVALSGPDQYLAQLTYQVAATDGAWTKSELRIDAKTVWVPPRSPTETAQAGSVVEVTGFHTLSIPWPPGGPVTVIVTGPRAEPLIHAFDSLPLGPSSTSCHEGLEYFSLDISRREGTPATFAATENACVNYVGVTARGRPAPALSDRSCALLLAVAAALPAGALATKSAAAACSRGKRRRQGLPPTVTRLQ